MATAASRTTNPLLLGLMVAVVAFVVSARRSDAPWASGFRSYLAMGAVVIGLRVVFRMLLDAQYGEHIIVTLPELPVPSGTVGIRLGGPVSAEGLLAAFYDGLRLATLLVCLGAANVLANPKRLLKSVPSALHEVGVAVTVALSVAPQIVESTQRISRARKLRGDVGRRTRWFRQVAVPVLTDALDRSLLLAAGMDSRGYGRTAGVARGSRNITGLLVLGGLMGICVGVYGLLDSTTPPALGAPMLITGVAAASAGLYGSSARVRRTRYRPDPWRLAEWGVSWTGVAVAAALIMTSIINPAVLDPSTQPLQWPQFAMLPAVGILLGAGPAWIAPPPLRGAAASEPPALEPADTLAPRALGTLR